MYPKKEIFSLEFDLSIKEVELFDHKTVTPRFVTRSKRTKLRGGIYF